MMKIAETLKSLQITALRAISELLNQIPNVQVESVAHQYEIGRNVQIGGYIGFNHGGVSYGLLVETKSDGAPRFARSGVFQLKGYAAHLSQSSRGSGTIGQRWIPILVSPYLSPESRALCRDHDVAYLDLVGNSRLAFDNVYIDRTVATKPKSETRSLRSIFTPKAGAILRVMLRNPKHAWRVAELAERANASLGHVSNVRKVLLNREWVEKQNAGVVLTRPATIMKTWRKNYRLPKCEHICGYTCLHGNELEKRLSGVLNPYLPQPLVIYSLQSAALWLAPYARVATCSFYADKSGLQRLEQALDLKRVARGASVVVRVLANATLFENAIEPKPGVFCADPVITYLDLWNGSDRDREAADHLAKEFFPWLT